MKRILILIFFALELVAVFTGGKVSVGIIAVSAQNMGNESTLPYECDGIPSNIPCDEVEICPCPYCDYSDDCDEIDFHVSVMHGNEGERPTDPDAPGMVENTQTGMMETGEVEIFHGILVEILAAIQEIRIM